VSDPKLKVAVLPFATPESRKLNEEGPETIELMVEVQLGAHDRLPTEKAVILADVLNVALTVTVIS
jgi:uroporphyrinogen-III decarboxylase